jgi:dTDP-4-dehydrorhamnose reductase
MADDGPMGRQRRWLVTGARGQAGTDVCEAVAARHPDDLLVPLGRSDLDVTVPAAVDAAISQHGPDVVVNCAAWTAVDDAEQHEAAAHRLNADAPGHLAVACSRAGARLIHISTDYVFDGSATSPIPEDAPVAPVSAYGRTKAAGERAVLSHPGEMYVVRTAWVWGRTGGNFVKTILRLAAERDHLDVVADQHGAPTWSAEFAAGLVALGTADAGRAAPGIWHFNGGGETTWWGFARAIVTEAGRDADMVRPTTTDAFPRPAPRPAYSVLSTHKWVAAGLPAPRPWQDALAAAHITTWEPAVTGP